MGKMNLMLHNGPGRHNTKNQVKNLIENVCRRLLPVESNGAPNTRHRQSCNSHHVEKQSDIIGSVDNQVRCPPNAGGGIFKIIL